MIIFSKFWRLLFDNMLESELLRNFMDKKLARANTKTQTQTKPKLQLFYDFYRKNILQVKFCSGFFFVFYIHMCIVMVIYNYNFRFWLFYFNHCYCEAHWRQSRAVVCPSLTYACRVKCEFSFSRATILSCHYILRHSFFTW